MPTDHRFCGHSRVPENVAAEFRRHGIGAALMAEFERRAAAGGAGAFALVTSRAGSFYETLGYTGGPTYFKKWVATASGTS
jgi:GNAT superfamily N-acetyltransferase